MIDEMTNAALIEHVTGSDDSTEVEMELADRLRLAIQEIEHMVELVQHLRAEHGEDT